MTVLPADDPAEPIISLRGVSLGYGETPILNGVTFTVNSNEVVAVTGPNGCGKSTLVRGLVGLIPIHGSADILGVSIGGIHRRSRRRSVLPKAIGYVPQRHTVHGGIPATVREVAMSGLLPGRPWHARFTAEDDSAVDDAIELVGLTDRKHSSLATLSGGQQRRTLIARALVAKPKILVMDEPTAGVDIASQNALVGTLATLRQTGLTMVIVTHELEPLRSLITRTIRVENGRLIDDAEGKS